MPIVDTIGQQCRIVAPAAERCRDVFRLTNASPVGTIKKSAEFL
jgi:hypothetical protein